MWQKLNMRYIFLIYLFTTSLFAWGARGHRIVADIAAQHLTPETAQWVKLLLSGRSLEAVANNPDKERQNPLWKCAEPFHFVNIDDGLTYQASKKNPGGDIVVSLEYFTALLSDPKKSTAESVMALTWLVHLVGDLHQPLHSGRSCDKGGNKIDVLWLGKTSNLHKVWDSQIFSKLRWSDKAHAAYLEGSQKFERRENSMNFVAWAEETIPLRPQIYTCYQKDGCCRPESACKNGSASFGACSKLRTEPARLGYQYLEEHKPILDAQLYLAGRRLAELLNAIHTKAMSTQKQQSFQKPEWSAMEKCMATILKKK